MVMAPCAVLYELAKMAEDKSAQADTRAKAAALEAYLRAYHDRSQEYLKFSEQFRNVCAAAAHRSPPVAALAARLVAASREIDSEWERLKRDQGLDAGKWVLVCSRSTRSSMPGRRMCRRSWSPCGGTSSNRGPVTRPSWPSRKVVRNLHYLAVYGGSENDHTLKLSAVVQELCRQELRNRYFKEDQYGESTRGPLPNPSRPTEQLKR